MKRIVKSLVITVCIITAVTLTAQKTVTSDSIIGKWLDHSEKHGDSIIKVFKKNNRFFGKIIKMKNDKQLDEKNPDKSKRNLPLLKKVILKNFKYEDKKWKGGTIYDPKNGKTYSCQMWLENNDTLKLRGYIGVSLLGRTETWKRVKEKNL
ncbi:MAG: DUF2147 domain-containing protein [Victivallales bacterium]|nr:DUF2147 domain-containing protein [Victivallales bacterium]MCF7888719.1 DUF2147 domain-containing protein [Victivallales bacterium]